MPNDRPCFQFPFYFTDAYRISFTQPFFRLCLLSYDLLLSNPTFNFTNVLFNDKRTCIKLSGCSLFFFWEIHLLVAIHGYGHEGSDGQCSDASLCAIVSSRNIIDTLSRYFREYIYIYRRASIVRVNRIRSELAL